MRLSVLRLCTTILATAMLIGGFGCTSIGEPAVESTRAVESFSSTRASLDKAGGEIDRALAGLDKLSAGGDLPKSFKAYTAAVDDIESAGKKAQGRAQSMRELVQAYVTHWQGEIDQIRNPAIKQSLSDRRDTVRQHFDEVKKAAEEVRAAYQPFLEHLQEIERALALNLTPQTVAGLNPAFEEAKADGQKVRAKGDALRAAMDKMVAETSATPVTAR